MKKLIVIGGTLLFISVFLGLIFWMGEDHKLNELAAQVKKLKEKSPEKVAQNLQQLRTALGTIKEGEFPKYEGRLVIGENLKPQKKIPGKIEFINKADPEWDKKTISYLNESSDYDRKINITKKQGIIGYDNEHGVYLEQAVITFNQRDGTKGSFEAFINSETGAIEIVISKNINEEIEEPNIQAKNPDSKFNPFANNATPEEVKELNEGNTENIIENLNQDKLANFDAQQYEEEIKQQEKIIKKQNSDANYKKYVEELKRQISSENN